jgi:hypothetical protein
MTSEIENKPSTPIGTHVTTTKSFLSFKIASSTNFLFLPDYQRLINYLKGQVKCQRLAIRVEIQKFSEEKKKSGDLEQSLSKLNAENQTLSNQTQTDKVNLSKLNQNLSSVQKKNQQLERSNSEQSLDVKNQKNRNAHLVNEYQKIKSEFNQNAALLNAAEGKLRDLERKEHGLAKELEDVKNEAEQKMKSLRLQSNNNEKYLQQVFAQRNSPAALQLLQKRINAPPTKMDPDESIFTLPLPCLQEKVQQIHQSVATMKVSAAIFCKEDATASVSQDACSFGEVEGRLTFAVADGVSTSSRQAEWSKRLVSACIGPENLRESRFKNAQIQHKEDGEKLTPLIKGNLAWAWEEKLLLQSDATLLTGYIEPDGNTRLHRRGDTWAAMKKKNGRKWTIIFPPSAVNGTQAVNSHSPLVFDESIDLPEVSKLLVMTDGVALSDSKFLDELWTKVIGKDPTKLEEFVSRGRQEKTFDNDDITIVAIDTRGFRHN